MPAQSSTTTAGTLTADFTINGQYGNLKLAIGVAATVYADETHATQYHWSVASMSPGGNYQLSGETQAQATLTLQAVGAYVIQLSLSKGTAKAVMRHIVWAGTPQAGYRLPATGEPLRFTGNEDWAGDLLQVINDVDSRLPTPDQKAALDTASNPSNANPFVTQTQWAAGALTSDQKAALDAAHDPKQSNPFATLDDLPAAELTPDQQAALDAAHDPKQSNPFATLSDLPAPELTPDQHAALNVAHYPSQANGFATWNDLPAAELSADEKAALDAANTPSRTNPFATWSDLPQAELTADQKAALNVAHDPGPTNGFATWNDLPAPQLTADEVAAINAAKAAKMMTVLV